LVKQQQVIIQLNLGLGSATMTVASRQKSEKLVKKLVLKIIILGFESAYTEKERCH
jgi:hypothetical protein